VLGREVVRNRTLCLQRQTDVDVIGMGEEVFQLSGKFWRLPSQSE